MKKNFIKEVTLPGKWKPKSSYNSTYFLSRKVNLSLEINVSKDHCISEIIPFEAKENRFHLHPPKQLWLVKTAILYSRIASKLKETREERWSKEMFWGLASLAVGKSLMLWAGGRQKPSREVDPDPEPVLESWFLEASSEWLPEQCMYWNWIFLFLCFLFVCLFPCFYQNLDPCFTSIIFFLLCSFTLL